MVQKGHKMVYVFTIPNANTKFQEGCGNLINVYVKHTTYHLNSPSLNSVIEFSSRRGFRDCPRLVNTRSLGDPMGVKGLKLLPPIN